MVGAAIRRQGRPYAPLAAAQKRGRRDHAHIFTRIATESLESSSHSLASAGYSLPLEFESEPMGLLAASHAPAILFQSIGASLSSATLAPRGLGGARRSAERRKHIPRGCEENRLLCRGNAQIPRRYHLEHAHRGALSPKLMQI